MSRTALITGAASGIGLATTLGLARIGWQVYAGFLPHGRSPPSQVPDVSGCIEWLPLDVTDVSACASAVAHIGSARARLDALVNSAGIQATGPFEEIPQPMLRKVMEVNFFGAMNMTRACLPLMRSRRAGVIVMLSSLSGLIGLPFDGAYAASKFALEGISESLRYELEPDGIKVALIEPGAYATSLADIGLQTHRVSTYPAFQHKRARQSAMSHAVDPREAAAVIMQTLLDSAPRLRVPCGPQAVAVVHRLRELDEEQRREFALRAAHLT